ncbi:ribonuclease-III-like-domain-containing protein [Scheffersomyces amazonensis]|uniref:ribonuclease-III-like-domain-containing protein n=1 Tax=Scheffersomyces amazonensis TaxID=1078765 RepID=UPI00315CE1D8
MSGSIRQLARPEKAFNMSGLRNGSGMTYVPMRTIYLHKGSRVAGLKRDPEEVFLSNKGYKYGISEDNLKYIKGFLQDKYRISDELILQVLTHKSFGNGIKPYNEKLSAMGAKLLNLFFAKYVVNKPSSNELVINGKNLDVLGSPIARELCGKTSMGVFAKNNQLNSVMFWKPNTKNIGFASSGELTISAQVMYALVGAITFSYGKRVAEQFIEEKILQGNGNDTNSNKLETIAQVVVESATARKKSKNQQRAE